MSGTKAKGTKLKEMKLTSVDLVQRGANPDADICLYKGVKDEPLKDERSVLKKMFDLLSSLFKDDENNPLNTIDKADSKSFSEINNTREYREQLWDYNNALSESIHSIINDEDLDDTARLNALNTSLGQYTEKMKELFTALTGGENTTTEGADPTTKAEKAEKTSNEGEIDMEKIDKSLLSAEEQTQLDALLKKCTVEEGEPATPPVVDPAPTAEPTAEPTTKSADVDPAISTAIAELQEMKKGMEMTQLKEIAKKYVPLGKKEDELANTLYDLKKSGQANYDAYIAILDENLDLVNKSGMFGEVGKSTHSPVSKANGVVAQIEGIAKGYRDEDPNLDYNTSMMRAWENNPHLLSEYEKGE